MVMQFWEAQRRAKRRTFVIFIIFIAMTLGVAVLIEFLLGTYAKETKQPPMTWIGLLFIAITFLVAAWHYWIYNKRGGAAVAESVGGVEVTEKESHPSLQQLRNIISETAIANRLPIPKIYLLDVEQINAFAAGMKADNAAIAVTRGALEKLNRDELQGVIAHELGHVRNGDMRLNMSLAAMIMGFFIVFYLGIRMLEISVWTRGGGRGSPMGLIAIALLIAGVFTWFFGSILRSMVSRQRELLADASAVQYTRNPEGLIGALQKIDGETKRDMPKRGLGIAHMYFSHKSLWGRLFATHPSIAKRISALRGQ